MPQSWHNSITISFSYINKSFSYITISYSYMAKTYSYKTWQTNTNFSFNSPGILLVLL